MSALAAVPSASTCMTSPKVRLSLLDLAPPPAATLLAPAPRPPLFIGRDSRRFWLMSSNLFYEPTVKTPWPFHRPTPVCLSACVVALYVLHLCVRESPRDEIVRESGLWLLLSCVKSEVSSSGSQRSLRQNWDFSELCERARVGSAYADSPFTPCPSFSCLNTQLKV